MHPRLNELVDYLETRRVALLAAAEPLPGDRWAVRPSPDRWSVGEIAAHLHRVEEGVARMIAKRVTQARAAGHPPELESSSLLAALEGRGLTDRSRRLEAPTYVDPDRSPDRDESRRLLAESRAAMLDAIFLADGLALGAIKHTHPVLGEIDLYQWILFVGLHEERHRGQVEEVVGQLLESSGSSAQRSPSQPSIQ